MQAWEKIQRPARRGPGRDGRGDSDTTVEPQIDTDGRIAARIQDLLGLKRGDLAHKASPWIGLAGWAIACGVFEIVGAIKLRKEIDDEWLLIASGVLSVLFGILILMFPGASALGLAFAIGTFAVLYGILLTGFSLRLRKHAEVKI